jgi:hypothetical protein
MGTAFRRIHPVTRAVITSDFNWGVILDEYADGMLLYLGFHENQDALTSDDEWIVEKFTWGASGFFATRETLDGVWDDRATLDWR